VRDLVDAYDQKARFFERVANYLAIELARQEERITNKSARKILDEAMEAVREKAGENRDCTNTSN